MRSTFLLVTMLTLSVPVTLAQSEPQQTPPLRDTILTLDRALFDAFNACEWESFKQYLAEDIEFYQDNDDVTLTRAALEPSFRDRCRPDNPVKLRRKLVLESIEVHPIQGYGAVQLGTHQFWVEQDAVPDQLAATPKFVHLWSNSNGAWKITRVISYAH